MPALPKLFELQTRFYDGIVAGANAEQALLDCMMESGETGRRRIAAYRRSILGNMVGALQASYPVLTRIVGLPFFREVASAYFRAHPSVSGDLSEYGESFADFIAGWPHGRKLGYLPDVARLEWQVQQVYYASDVKTDLSGLAACPPEEYGALCFSLTPALARMDSAWPLADIWRVNAEGYGGEMKVDFARGARLAILRRDGLVHVESLTHGEAAFLDALACSDCLETAAASAQAAETGFDLAAALARFAGNGVFVRAWLPGKEEGGQA
ncbi:MAG: DNA-binding domain-containing protein [Georgfuchsia sp.]